MATVYCQLGWKGKKASLGSHFGQLTSKPSTGSWPANRYGRETAGGFSSDPGFQLCSPVGAVWAAAVPERKKRKEKSQYILSFKKMQSKSGGGFINASFKDIDLLLAVERSIGELLERCLEVNKEPGAYNSRIKAAEGEALGDTARWLREKNRWEAVGTIGWNTRTEITTHLKKRFSSSARTERPPR